MENSNLEEKWSHVIKARKGWTPLDVTELWRYRELLGFLIWRNILIRYKQTVIGILWAVIRPLLTMVAFVFLRYVIKGGSDDAVTPVMIFAALLPWQFFANALGSGSNSVVAAGNMVRKIYFPRLYIPTSDSMSGVLDFAVSLVILFILMLCYQVTFTWQLLLLPVFSAVALLAALGASLWLSSLNVKYRDVKYIVPFITQLGMFVSPVAYMTTRVTDSSQLSDTVQFIYTLNPLVGIIDGFRWAILGADFMPEWKSFLLSIGAVLVLFVTGLYYFRATEKTFADMI